MKLQGLYAIADYDSCEARGLDPYRVAQAMIEAEVEVVQLRAKTLSDEEFAVWIESTLAKRDRSVRVFVNDRADLALLLGADGVHLGQGDLPVSELRQLRPTLSVGLSTHDLAQLKQGQSTRADYLAFGPVFTTVSKRNAEPSTGLVQLREAHALCQASGVPLVAIGGITENSLELVRKHCDLVAAISLLLPSPGQLRPYDFIRERCSELDRRLR